MYIPDLRRVTKGDDEAQVLMQYVHTCPKGAKWTPRFALVQPNAKQDKAVKT